MTLKTEHRAEYDALRSAIKRCYHKRNISYPNYGGRGIRVCREWRDPKLGFGRFLAHVGPRPTPAHSLDRIDGNGHYEPGNVRWADKNTQSQNRRPWSHRPESWEMQDGRRVRKSDVRKRLAEYERVDQLMKEDGARDGD